MRQLKSQRISKKFCMSILQGVCHHMRPAPEGLEQKGQFLHQSTSTCEVDMFGEDDDYVEVLYDVDCVLVLANVPENEGPLLV